jgi:hypothetical protein
VVAMRYNVYVVTAAQFVSRLARHDRKHGTNYS